MSLTKQEIKQIRKEVEECKKPLFFFHDDPDGLCSFLLFYKIKKEGHGVILKIPPEMGVEFLRKVKEYDPDKIFILDKAKVSQEFIDRAKRKIIWIDHHSPCKRENVLYFNPRMHDKNDSTPVSYICYEVAQKDLWLGVTGTIGDWTIPAKIEEFRKKYPDLRIFGGFDKNALYKGKEFIDKELEKMPYLIKKGGFIPFADHDIPPNSPWENFKYYRNRLNDIVNSTKVLGKTI